jgi:peptidoglycan/xylan/chitin deacetylase (PgdA/CDA1 family)
VVFAISGRVGAENDWDQAIGARALPLMDAAALQRVAAAGVEIGSHGRSHMSFEKLDPAAVPAELAQSADELEALGLPRPRLFAYPYGPRTPAAPAAARAAGYAAAFTIEPGPVGAGADAFLLPRLLVMRGFTPRVLRLRLASLRCGRSDRVEQAFEIVGTRG